MNAVADKRTVALQLRTRGMTWRQVADQLGYKAQSSAYRLVHGDDPVRDETRKLRALSQKVRELERENGTLRTALATVEDCARELAETKRQLRQAEQDADGAWRRVDELTAESAQVDGAACAPHRRG